MNFNPFAPVPRYLFLSSSLIVANSVGNVCNAQTLGADPIPDEGIAQNDTRGIVPGDKMNAVEDLKEIYKALITYRTQNDGMYPKEIEDFMASVQF